tara:strand:+ start:3746 stop:5932 length:2187 start_codon:yes stop_codon:yes gene_type:complete
MKKLILYLISFIFLIFSLLLLYISNFEIKTKSFNNQIKDRISKFDKNINIEINEVKLLFNIKRFNIEAKIVDPKIKFKNNNIDIESIKSLVSIKSMIKRDFALKNLHIETKSTDIKKIINLIKLRNNTPQIYILQNRIKDGNLVAYIKINFDNEGKIKDDYEIDGYVENGKINLLNNFKLNKIGFSFKIKENKYDLENIKLSLNKLNFFSKKILLINENNTINVNGSLSNKIAKLEKDEISNILRLFSSNYEIEKIDFSSKNIFSFRINKRFKISDLSFDSKIKLENLLFKNDKKGKYFFPEIKEKIIFTNHDIQINLKEDNFIIEGFGNVLMQNKFDKLTYSLNNKNQSHQFDILLELNENPFSIEFLNYKKKKSKAVLKTKTSLNRNNEIDFKIISIQENNDKILLENISLGKNLKIKKIDKINLDYIDYDNRENSIQLKRKNNSYNLTGDRFNVDKIITKLIKNKTTKNDLFQNNFDIKLKINKIYLDNNFLQNLNGELSIVDNKVKIADISAKFLDNQKLIFLIKSKKDKKITTFFSEKAKPIVKRYDFIKGFEGGTLDFYSESKNGKSTSTLKIFDFKLQELPALTKLLTLASLQGIADTLTGEGIRFNELEMNFTDEDTLMTIDELYAIGPAISILMNGYIEKDKLISLRGTLVPATTLNKTIGSIPFLGKILVGSKAGEGVFGVSFKIKGSPNNLETKVNPIKTLTPRFITRTLEKIKKTN